MEHHKDLALTLSSAGHELALHGYNHHLWQGKGVQRKSDALKAIEVFNEVVGQDPLGFRAPYGNIDEEIMGLLEENGIQYDSSIVPTLLRVEGGRMILQTVPFKGVPAFPYHPSHKDIFAKGKMKIVEIPFSVLPIARIPIGFGYVVLLGLNFYRFFIRFFDKELMIFYLHQYELHNETLSAGVPTIIRPYYRKRVNPLSVLSEFFEFMIRRFSPNFLRMDEVIKGSMVKC